MDKKKENELSKIIPEPNNKFLNNEIQRLIFENFHLQNYSSQIYKDYLCLHLTLLHEVVCMQRR